MRSPDSWRNAPLTVAIVAVTAAAFLIASILPLDIWSVAWGAFWPARPPELALLPLWLTPLSATLVHVDWVHLLFNLIVLAFCGRQVEWALRWPGVATLYLLGAYAAAGAQYAVSPVAPMIGASGAVSAVIGAYAMLFGRNKVRIASPRLATFLNMLWLMVAWVVMQICLGIAMAGPDFLFSGEGVQIAVSAHIGGFLVGVLLANPLLLFRYRKA